MNDRNNIPKTYIRLLQAVPSILYVDVYAENKLLFKELSYEDFSKYVILPSGTYLFRFTKHEQKESFYEKKLSLMRGTLYTLILAPKYKGTNALNLFLIEDTLRPLAPNHCFVRIGHFYKPIAHLDSKLNEEGPYFKNLVYGQLSQYLPCKPQNYSISFKDFTLDALFLELPKNVFKISRFYSIYLIGTDIPVPTPKALISIDGNSFLTV